MPSVEPAHFRAVSGLVRACRVCIMRYGLGITCWERFLGRIFSQFVRTRMGVLGIDTFSRACSFPGSFGPCAGLQGVHYALWPRYHLLGALFGPHFFTICADKNGGAWDRYLQ